MGLLEQIEEGLLVQYNSKACSKEEGTMTSSRKREKEGSWSEILRSEVSSRFLHIELAVPIDEMNSLGHDFPRYNSSASIIRYS